MRRALEVVGLVVAVVVLYTVPACAVVAEDNVAAGEAVAAEQPAADKDAPKGDDAPKAPKLNPCCEAICKTCVPQVGEAQKAVDEAMGKESKDEANAQLDVAAKLVGAMKTDMDTKMKPAKKAEEGAAEEETKAPPTPPCCKKLCGRCLPKLGMALKAIEAAKAAETLDAAKPEMEKASKALAAMKGDMEKLMKPAKKAEGEAKAEEKDKAAE